MAILFKCECGALWKAEDDYAGQQSTCGTCGRQMTIPPESDPDCVMVFKSGLDAEGVLMTLSMLQEQIMAGQFGANDLILYEGVWRPIGSVFDSMPEPPPPPVPEGEDIAVSLSELPAIAGFKPLSERSRRSASYLHRKASYFLRRYSALLKWTGIAAAGVLLLLALFHAVLLVHAHIRWNPAYVMVCNPNPVPMVATLGRRQLTIEPNGSAVFQDIILPRAAERRLTVLPAAATAKPVATVTVDDLHLEPGMDIVVNPKGRRPLYSCRLDRAQDQAVHAKETENVFSAITGRQSPEAAVAALEKQLMEIAKKVGGQQTTQEILTSNQYNLADLSIPRSAKYTKKAAAHGNGARDDMKPALKTVADVTVPAKGLPFQYSLSSHRILSFDLTPEKPRSMTPFDASKYKERQISLSPFKTSTLHYRLDDKGVVQLTMTVHKANVTVAGVKSQGHWTYSATRNKSGSWKWSWTYSGKAKGKPVTLVYERDFSGGQSLK